MLPGCPNIPRWSAIRCRLLHPPHRATTTPLSYDSRQTVFTDLVSQTLQVKIMARSCLADGFKLEFAEYFTVELSLLFILAGAFTESQSGFKVPVSWFSKSSLAWLVGCVCVWIPLWKNSDLLKDAFAEGRDRRDCHKDSATNKGKATHRKRWLRYQANNINNNSSRKICYLGRHSSKHLNNTRKLNWASKVRNKLFCGERVY